jgi:hypothetical protein
MTCRDFEADVVDLARGVEIDADAAVRLGRHLERCPACTASLAREQELTAALKAMAAAGPVSTRAQEIEADLVAAFEAQRAAGAKPLASPHPVPMRRQARAWLAAAAVLVLAVAAWQVAVRRHPPGDAAPGVETERARAGASPGSDPARQAGGQEVPFVALPTALGLPALESGRIVRVELPAAELPAYGFVLEPQPSGGAVEADVLVGQDGQPRAIRFVTAEADSRRPQ